MIVQWSNWIQTNSNEEGYELESVNSDENYELKKNDSHAIKTCKSAEIINDAIKMM